MKRYTLSFLLSAVYVGFLCLVFSSDVSKENNFLYPQGDVFEVAESGFLETQLNFELPEGRSQSELALMPVSGGHSPESAGL